MSSTSAYVSRLPSLEGKAGFVTRRSGGFGVQFAKALTAFGAAVSNGARRLGRLTTASALSFGVRPPQAAYATSKAAVLGLTCAMEADLWQHETDKAYIAQSPPRRLGQIAELLGPLILLAIDASSFMTGAASVVDGGHTTHII